MSSRAIEPLRFFLIKHHIYLSASLVSGLTVSKLVYIVELPENSSILSLPLTAYTGLPLSAYILLSLPLAMLQLLFISLLIATEALPP
jgi:hypothetical protein